MNRFLVRAFGLVCAAFVASPVWAQPPAPQTQTQAQSPPPQFQQPPLPPPGSDAERLMILRSIQHLLLSDEQQKQWKQHVDTKLAAHDQALADIKEEQKKIRDLITDRFDKLDKNIGNARKDVAKSNRELKSGSSATSGSTSTTIYVGQPQQAAYAPTYGSQPAPVYYSQPVYDGIIYSTGGFPQSYIGDGRDHGRLEGRPIAHAFAWLATFPFHGFGPRQWGQIRRNHPIPPRGWGW